MKHPDLASLPLRRLGGMTCFEDQLTKLTDARQSARARSARARSRTRTKRDLARALGVQGDDRITLKRILKELESEGAARARPAEQLRATGALPEVTVLEITGQDPTANCSAARSTGSSDEAPPQILSCRAATTQARRSGAANACWRALAQASDGYEARVIKRLGASVHSVLGV